MYRRGLGVAPSFSFAQTSGSGYPNFHVGDSWQLVVRGDPNQPVYVFGGKDGANTTNLMGKTDASGVFTLTGTMTADQIGNWFEQWIVGGNLIGGTVVQGQVAGQFSFTVLPAQQTPPTTQPTQPTTTQPTPTSPAFVNTVLNASGLQIAGYDVPWWAVAGVGAGLLFFLSGRRR